MYSFALRPAESAPSGSLNLSRIDNTTLQLQYKKASGTTQTPVTDESACNADAANLKLLQIFSLSYNVLRVAGGLAGLAFAN